MDVVLAANLSEADLRLALALALFQDGRITLAQGARLASLDRLAFQQQLAARKLQIHDWRGGARLRHAYYSRVFRSDQVLDASCRHSRSLARFVTPQGQRRLCPRISP